jgi:anti-anti-sigma factor
VADAAAGRTLVLDMRGVSQIDAAGLGLLVALSTEVRRRGGCLRLARASRRVGALVRVTGLSGVLGMATEPASSSAA